MNRQWIYSRAHSLDSIFVFGYTIRTNNNTEGNNRRLKMIAVRSNLNVYRLIEVLFNESLNVAIVSLI